MKNQKGITLITLTITIVVMIILTFTITVNVEPYKNQRIKTKFETDMQNLTEEISQYYASEKDLPIINKYTNIAMLEDVKNVNDGDEYYVLDLEQLDIELNYGQDYTEIVNNIDVSEEISESSYANLTDVYIINKQSHTVYYPKGVEYDGENHYTIEQTYTEINDVTIKYLQDNKIYVTTDMNIQDRLGNKVMIPSGFKIAEDSGLTVEEGIVIEDDDIIEGIGNDRGNQYVWIPVGEGIKKSDNTTVDITLGRYTFANGTSDTGEDNTTILEKGTPILEQNAENYLDESGPESYKELVTSRTGVASDTSDGLNTTALNLKEFIDSVKENGGYYISRYEATYGVDEKVNSKVSNSFSSSATAPTTRVEGMLWNHITQMNAAIACRELYKTVTTDLINSYAWDTAIVYIQELSGDVDYSMQDAKSINGSLTNTGVNDDKRCNIYDLAANAYEWTTEYCGIVSGVDSAALPCTTRGGLYSHSRYYTKTRNAVRATFSYTYATFRAVLYI